MKYYRNTWDSCRLFKPNYQCESSEGTLYTTCIRFLTNPMYSYKAILVTVYCKSMPTFCYSIYNCAIDITKDMKMRHLTILTKYLSNLQATTQPQTMQSDNYMIIQSMYMQLTGSMPGIILLPSRILNCRIVSAFISFSQGNQHTQIKGMFN